MISGGRREPGGAGSLRVGAAKADITPPDLSGLNLLGGGGAFTGVHDPLALRALYASDGRTEIAIVTLDLVEVGDMTSVRQRIAVEIGIPADHVVVTASHCHNAPRLGLMSPGSLAKNGGPETIAYTGFVYDQIIATLSLARAGARPALLGLGVGAVDVNVCRDRRDPATGAWGLGYEPDGPSDKTVWVLRFTTPDGEPIAILMNYAVHPNVAFGTGEVSADISGAAARHVEERLGGGVVALWTAGPMGDQAARVTYGCPIADPGRDAAAAYAAAEAQGLLVGAEVVRVAAGIVEARSDVPLRAEERVVACPVKADTDLEGGLERGGGATVNLRLLLLMFGEVALAGVSGEMVVPVYRLLRERSPLDATIALSMANDRIGYLVDEPAYERGTFEAHGSPIAPGHAAAAIVDGFAGMIARNRA